jgi:putative glutamine transport system permease protein
MFKGWMWAEVFSSWRVFAQGLLGTITVSVVSLILMLLLSLLAALIRVGRHRTLRWFTGVLMGFFQNTPLLVQVFFLYNVLPLLGVKLPVFAVGSISLSVYTAAFGAAIFEAAINSVPKGQTEAAYSQGFGFFTTMMRIVLPQALKVAIPPMTGQVVNLIKNSSVLAMVALGELMYMTDSWSAEHAIYGPTFIVTAVLYLCLCLPLARLSRNLEMKTRR